MGKEHKVRYKACIDCGKPKITRAEQYKSRCLLCSLRSRPKSTRYYTTCIDCGKPKSRNYYPRCKPCSKKFLWLNPEFRAKQDIAHSDPDILQRQSESHKQIWADPEKREKQRQTQLESWSDPELRARHSDTLKQSYSGIFSSDKERYDTICAHLSQYSEKAPNWPNDEDYGEDFNDWLKNQIRARDKFRCVLCGKSQFANGVALSVHHVNYIKTDNRPENLQSLCKKCHTKTNHRRKFWQELFTTYLHRQPLQDWQHRAIMSSEGWTPISSF